MLIDNVSPMSMCLSRYQSNKYIYTESVYVFTRLTISVNTLARHLRMKLVNYVSRIPNEILFFGRRLCSYNIQPFYLPVFFSICNPLAVCVCACVCITLLVCEIVLIYSVSHCMMYVDLYNC